MAASSAGRLLVSPAGGVWPAAQERPVKEAEVMARLNTAIQNGTLPAYLKSLDPNEFVSSLSDDWGKFPYREVLQVCDARIAKVIIARMAAILARPEGTRHVVQAFEVFNNSSERLDVFITAVKLGRAEPVNSIPVRDLWLAHGGISIHPLYGQLPRNIARVLKIEYDLLNSDAQRAADQAYNDLLASVPRAAPPAGSVKV